MEDKNLTNRKQIRRILTGAAGITKSVMNINTAPEEIILKRRNICKECEHAVGPRKDPKRKVKCKLCGCLINHKTRLKGEKCPAGKWSVYVEKK